MGMSMPQKEKIMILDKKIKVTVSGKYKTYYENKGYKLPYAKDKRGRIGIKKGSSIFIDIDDLPKYSQVPLTYKCDDCGVIKSVPAQSILGRDNSQYNKTGETLCSNCANKRMVGEKNSQYKHGNNRFCEYRSNARRRQLEFNLSIEEFEELVSKECHYCGGFSVDRFEKSRGQGIDRKNSEIGYVSSNCVPCCSTCNFVKNSMRYDDFIKYIRKLYKRTKSYEI